MSEYVQDLHPGVNWIVVIRIEYCELLYLCFACSWPSDCTNKRLISFKMYTQVCTGREQNQHHYYC